MNKDQALKRSEARFKAAVEAVSGVIWTNSPDGRMLNEQPGWGELTGQTFDEYQNFGWSNVVHPEDQMPTITAWVKSVETITKFEVVHRVRCADGAWRHFHVRAVPVKDEHGVLVEWVGIHTDITAAVAAEAALAASEERYRSIVEGCATMLWINDSTGHCIVINKAFQDFTGVKFDEHFDFAKLCHKDSVAVREESRRNIALGERYKATIQLKTADSTYRWCETIVSPIKDADGIIVSWIGCAIDINDRVTAGDKIVQELEVKKLLLDELNHRVRNTLTIVQAMARQTVKNADDLRDFADTFEGRLFGLSATHDLLVEGSWNGAKLIELLSAELEPVCQSRKHRWSVSGEDAIMNANQAVSIGMMAHELATNAVKYGSLSNNDGELAVTLVRDDKRMTLSWVETGGPAVVAPARMGFGTRLLKQIERQLRGELTIDYAVTGLSVMFGFPLD